MFFMKVNVTQPLTDFEGKALIYGQVVQILERNEERI